MRQTNIMLIFCTSLISDCSAGCWVLCKLADAQSAMTRLAFMILLAALFLISLCCRSCAAYKGWWHTAWLECCFKMWICSACSVRLPKQGSHSCWVSSFDRRGSHRRLPEVWPHSELLVANQHASIILLPQAATGSGKRAGSSGLGTVCPMIMAAARSATITVAAPVWPPAKDMPHVACCPGK